MSKILITGSAAGLGRETTRLLIGAGHEVVLHGRDEARMREALAGVPGASAALAGDLASIAYADSKLFDAVLAAAVARHWPEVVSSSVDPGWVKTRMGGPTAPGDWCKAEMSFRSTPCRDLPEGDVSSPRALSRRSGWVSSRPPRMQR
jgi:nucleoside-diphosphate-sugar epimerase